MQQARWGDAEALISESVRLYPTDERMRAQYAETLWNLHARQDAILHMQLAVKLSAGNPDLLVRLSMGTASFLAALLNGLMQQRTPPCASHSGGPAFSSQGKPRPMW